MNAIVIYKSNTGFTEKYALWIANELNCQAVNCNLCKNIDLTPYNAVIFGGWLLAGTINGLKEYKEKLLSFKGKKAIFVVGSMQENTKALDDTLKNCLSESEHKELQLFYMRGGLNYDKMGFVHKMMMKAMCSVLKKKHGENSEEYKTISQSFDATDKEYIKPLIEFINN